VASAAPNSIGTFFGELFGSKRNNPTADVRDTSLAQPAPIQSQVADTAPSSARAQTKVIATTREMPEAPRTQSVDSPRDAGGARTANVLIGALPIVPSGTLETRFGVWH